MNRLRQICFAVWALCLGGAALTAAAAGPAASGRCEAQSPAQRQTVVELYTSEGCNSCPPADKWLSTLKSRPGVLAAAFHVDYWNNLGWEDRFSSARYTRRQADNQVRSGARFNYTPQVVANGQDWHNWPRLPDANPAATVRISLQRQSPTRLLAEVTPLPGAPAKLGLWWARLEDGHESAVRAGENVGVTLRHDHVVRDYAELPAWANAGVHALTLETGAAAPRQPGARWLVVVTDGPGGAPLQAVEIGC